MSEIEGLQRRMVQLEFELAAVISETEQLQRANERKKRGRRLVSLVAALALAAYWCLAAIAAPGPGTTVAAPFQVVDANNQPIFEVKSSPHAFVVYNASGGYALSGSALDKDAFFKVGPAYDKNNIVLGLHGQVPNLRFRSGGGDRDRILFQVAAGGTPMMIIYGGNGQDIMQLREGLRGEGTLQLNNSNGGLRVLADVSEGGYGKVEALPLGNPLGSAIVGRPKAQ